MDGEGVYHWKKMGQRRNILKKVSDGGRRSRRREMDAGTYQTGSS